MSKKHKKGKALAEAGASDANPKAARKAAKKRYEAELDRLQVELAYLQSWVKATGARIIVVFEGRDAAGKGGVIKAPDRACQPPRLPRHRAARAFGPGKDPDVLPALHGPLPRRG